MKKITTRAAIMAAITIPGFSASLTWNSASPGGVWDTTSASWLDGASPAAWNNAAPDSAVFGATGAGTVTLGTDITAGGVTIDTAGYTISGDTLTLAGAAPAITTAADATISSVITGSSGLTKAGGGQLDLTGANTYGGVTTVNGGTLKISTPQTGNGAVQVNAGTLALNGGANSDGYRLTRGPSITVESGAEVSMLVAFPWGWYGNNDATGITVHLNGGTFKMNNLHQGSFGVGASLTGGSIDGGGTASRWELGRSGGFNAGIASLASPVTSTITAGILMMRADSGQLSYPISVAQGTAPGGIDLDISSSISGGATTIFNKTGAGTLRLTGVSTHTGPTLVSEGKLVLGAAAVHPSTPVTVSPGAVLDVLERPDFTVASGKTLVAGRAGTAATDITGNIVVAAGGALTPAGAGTVGTLTIAGNLALDGGTLSIDQAGGISDRISPTGTLALTGTNTFSAAAGYFPAGTYTLASGYSSVTGGASNLAWGSAARGQTASFAVTPADVQMTLSAGAPAALTWSGTTSGVWDVDTTANWNAGAEKFFQLDAVTFADAPANATVTLTGAVAPASVAFTNATTAYIVRGGTGSIAGTGSITKSNAGTVALWNGANTFSGGTVIDGGTLSLDNGAALASGTYSPLGTGPVTVNSGVLQLDPGHQTGGTYTFPNAITLAGGTLYQDDGVNHLPAPVTVTAPSVIKGHYGGKDVYLDGGLAGSADLTVSDEQGYGLYGSGAVHVTADGSYSGKITVDLGHLVIRSDNALPNAEVAVQTTQADDGWGNNVGLTLAGPAANVTLAALSGTSATAHVQNGDATTRTLTINSGVDRIFAGMLGSGAPGNSNPNRLNLVKSGTGSLTLAGSNTYTGTTTVSGGRLILASSNSSLDYEVAAGATLGVNILPASPTLFADDISAGAGSSFNFLNFAGNTTSPAIDTLTMDTAGTVTLNIAGTFAPGTFPLIYSAGGFGGTGIGAFVLGTLPRGVLATLDTSNPSTVYLVVSGTDSLTWKGNLSSEWDIETTTNWTLGGVADTFREGDAVRFDNTAGANTNVSLNTVVSPAGIAVDSTAAYVIGGSGSVAGTGGISKSGSGSLEINTANTFDGDVQVNDGILRPGTATALGSTVGGTSVAEGATLDLNGQTIGAEPLALAGSLVNESFTPASLAGVVTLGTPASVGGSGAVTLTSNISGGSDLTKTGFGVLNLSAPSPGLTGFFTVQDGVVNLLAPNALPNSKITIEGPGILAVGINNALRNPVQEVTVKSGGLLTVNDGFTTNFGTLAGSNFLTLEGGGELGGSNPDAYWGSWTINTVDRKIVVDGGAAEPAWISARSVTPNGDILRLAVSDVTGDAAADLVVTGSFGSQYDVGFDVEIDGGGTVEFAAANAHTGVTRVVSGQLVLTTPTALADTSALELGDDATLVLDFAGTETVGSLVIAGATLPNGTYGTGGTPHAAISGTGTLQVGPSDPYLAWAELHGLAGAGAEVDSDGDGIANGIEFILGADPFGPDSDSNSLLPTATTTGTDLVFVFRCREDALAIADVEYDADLVAPWTVAIDGEGGVDITLEDGIYPNDPIDNKPVTKVTVTIPRAGSKLFARLIGTFPSVE